MLTILNTPLIFQLLALIAALFASCGSLAAAAFYRGKDGERYSLLNHFISELGEVGVSRWAWAFNWGMIVSGIFMFLACISLGLILPGVWSKIGMISGLVASIALIFVGIYPMSKITPHTRAAVTYFRSGLGMVIFFTLAIAIQSEPIFPRLFSLAGLPAILAFSFFLVYSSIVYRHQANSAQPGDPPPPRPRFWALAFSEWTIFLTIVPFFFVIALGM